MNMLKKWGLLICLCLGAGAVMSEGVPEQALAQKLQQAPDKRFNYLRFYLPSNKVAARPGLWEQWFTSKTENEHQRALAFYLFNMYATTNSYQQAAPAVLTLNDIGVLDGFMMCSKPFDFKNALRFYQANKAEVHAWLDRFFAGRSLPWPQPAAQDYERWVKLLEKQPLRRAQAAYMWPLPNYLRALIPTEMNDRFLPFLRAAQKQGKQQVVLYDEPAASLEDLDSHIGPKTARRARTYRFVKDECNYMSYLVARMLTKDVLQSPNTWGFTRIYTLTATPLIGEFLTPARGERFKLASGQNGLKWRYHTAVLAVVPRNGSYVPVVLDTFLGGLRPLPVSEWLSHFSANTVFTAAPFRPSAEVENALRMPEKISGNVVWFNGQKYTPAQVIE